MLLCLCRRSAVARPAGPPPIIIAWIALARLVDWVCLFRFFFFFFLVCVGVLVCAYVRWWGRCTCTRIEYAGLGYLPCVFRTLQWTWVTWVFFFFFGD